MLLNKCRNKTSWEIIYNILNFMKNTTNIIIFDQFKKSNINEIYYNKIKLIVESSTLKLVLCSSINDIDIRQEVIKLLYFIKEIQEN